jgi:hypothetical protein
MPKKKKPTAFTEEALKKSYTSFIRAKGTMVSDSEDLDDILEKMNPSQQLKTYLLATLTPRRAMKDSPSFKATAIAKLSTELRVHEKLSEQRLQKEREEQNSFFAQIKDLHEFEDHTYIAAFMNKEEADANFAEVAGRAFNQEEHTETSVKHTETSVKRTPGTQGMHRHKNQAQEYNHPQIQRAFKDVFEEQFNQ